MDALPSANRADTFYQAWQAGAKGRLRQTRLIVPTRADDLADHYDLTLSHPSIDVPQLSAFEDWLANAAERLGLSCALLHDGVVQDVIRRLEQGRLHIGFHLDYFALWHVADDPYARLAQAVQDAGGRTVNPPARARLFTDKAAAHAELMRRGLGVPETVILRPGSDNRPLTTREHQRLKLDAPGARVYAKPANGFGQRGVVRTDAAGLSAILTAVRKESPGDTLLIQREIGCPRLQSDDGVVRPAYWRVLYCFGEVLPFWWSKWEPNSTRPSYQPLTPGECRRHGLAPVLAFVRDLARLCELDWFSTEVCLGYGPETSRYTVLGVEDADANRRTVRWPVLAIDYFNDQCDVDVQSRWLGAPPDGVVEHIAERFAEVTARLKYHRGKLAKPAPHARAA